MVDKLINQVYLNNINLILQDIEENDKEEISKNYLKYLYSIHSDEEINEENYDEMLDIITSLETKKWSKRGKDGVLFYFKKDKSFDIINNISKKSYSLATSKLDNNKNTISKEDADKYISILIDNLDKVYDFNKEEAKRLVSEGILDFEYASGSNDNIKSFRVGHLK